MLTIILVVVLLGIIVAVSSIYDNNSVKIRSYNITSDKIKNKYRIVFLSDLHGNSFGDKNSKLINAVDRLNPDIILIGGDMITARKEKIESKNWDNALALLEGIKDNKVYYGIGNHEYRMDLYREDFGDAFDRLKMKIENLGISVLYNDTAIFGELTIKGLAIDRSFYKRFEKHVMKPEYVSGEVGKREYDKFTVMLAHNPEYFNAYSKEADLVLSGHVHGGIARLPLLGGVISPRLSLFPKYDGGRFDKDGSVMIISRGLGSHTLPFRFFNPCEICVIELEP